MQEANGMPEPNVRQAPTKMVIPHSIYGPWEVLSEVPTMTTHNMYRPVVRVSPAIVGFVAGVCDPQAKFADNVKARIRLAIEEMGEAMKAKNHSAFQGATRRKLLLEKVLKGATLSHDDAAFCGLVVSQDPEVRDSRTLEQLQTERLK